MLEHNGLDFDLCMIHNDHRRERSTRRLLEWSRHEKCFRKTKWPDNKTIDPKSLSRGLRWLVLCSIWVIVTVIWLNRNLEWQY